MKNILLKELNGNYCYRNNDTVLYKEFSTFHIKTEGVHVTSDKFKEAKFLFKLLQSLSTNNAEKFNNLLFRNFSIFAITKNQHENVRNDYYYINGDLFYVTKQHGNIISFGYVLDQKDTLKYLINNNKNFFQI